MIREEEVFPIGRITRQRGTRGELEMRFTDDVFDRADAPYLVLRLDGILVPFFWESYRFKSDTTIILQLENIDTQEQALRLVGTEVLYPFSAVRETDMQTLSSFQALCGFSLYTADGSLVGTIDAVNDATANILLYVRRGEGEEIILPYHDDFLVDYDLQKRRLTLQLPEGILELNT